MGGAALVRDAVVLSLLDFGEKDRIVRLLTAEEGRVGALARGVRGSRRRFGGVLDVGNRVSCLLRPGRGDLWQLDGAELRGGGTGQRDDLLRMALGIYACEVVGSLSQELHGEPRMFGLLETFLSVIDVTPPGGGVPGTAVRLALEAKALTFAGFAPVLTACARCGGSLDPDARFDPALGGAVHPACGAGDRVSLHFLEALEHGRRIRLKELYGRGLPAGPPWLLARFAEHHLGHGLRSRDWLSTLETA